MGEGSRLEGEDVPLHTLNYRYSHIRSCPQFHELHVQRMNGEVHVCCTAFVRQRSGCDVGTGRAPDCHVDCAELIDGTRVSVECACRNGRGSYAHA